MANKHGDFIWYELMTPDAAASEAFYGPLLGWRFGGGADYREINASEGGVGGMMQLTPEMAEHGARPIWTGYILVDDVDASVAAIAASGGHVFMPARTMEGVGRFALLADPQRAPFYVMTPTPPADNPDAASNAYAADRPMIGHCAWNELATDDPAAAIGFYAAHFGWEKDSEMDMGPAGTYTMLRHGPMLGGVMARMPEMPASAWAFYFRVPDIDVAAAAITANGGTMIMGPVEVPGGDFALNAIDPQGAHFALVGTRAG